MSAPDTTALAILNARLLDPATDYDGPGAVLVSDGRIVEVVHGAGAAAPDGVEVVDAGGLCLSPGLIDIRVKTGEPGAEPKETLKSAALSSSPTPTRRSTIRPWSTSSSDAGRRSAWSMCGWPGRRRGRWTATGWPRSA